MLSQRGQSGGWRMARPPADVSVADVIRAVDGPLVSVYGLRPESVSYSGSAEVLQHVWIAARRSLRDVFEEVSIQQLADGKLPDAVTVADVIRAVDGPLVSVYGLRPEAVSYNESADVLQHVWIAARSSLRDVFEHVSIRALADGRLPRAVTSRTQSEDAWQPH